MSDNPSSFDHAFRSADNKTDDNDTIKFYKPPKQIVFFDTEVSTSYKRISDTGAVKEDGTVLHTESVGRLLEFLSHGDYICGHNIFEHDLKYLDKEVKGISAALESVAIDTLYLSPLLFPKRPYHSLLKDDKLESDELNNPVNDSIKAKELFYDELNAYNELPSLLRQIYYSLLSRVKEFRAFFSYTGDNTDFVELSSAILNEFDGRICSNAELQMQGLLIRHGIAAKLIRDTGRYRFYNLAEVRYLLKKLEEDRHSPVISDNAWEFAKRKLSEQYSRSDCLETVLNMMNEFEIVNNKKYYSDLIEFIKESSYEDFYPDGKNSVTVSTIHKSKGREFDRVYILITNGSKWSEEDKRKLYVGMTRAKKQLHIHCCSDLFLRYSELCANFFNDESLYPEPAEITLQMTHKDVFLDYSEKKRELIFRLRSGDRLTIENNYLIACINGKNQRVVKFSRDFSDRLRDHAKRGYLPCSVVVRFIVAWKNDKHEKEIPVILSDITLKKDAAPKP